MILLLESIVINTKRINSLSKCTVNETNKNASLPTCSIEGSVKDDEICIEYGMNIMDSLSPLPSGEEKLNHGGTARNESENENKATREIAAGAEGTVNGVQMVFSTPNDKKPGIHGRDDVNVRWAC